MRDITLGDTFRHHFTTRQFSDGVPTVLSGTPVLSVLEENNVTPITAGVSVSVDMASVVGLNEATIIATSGNGYESGKSYSIYISTGTVGGTSVVGEVVGHFTVEQSAAAVDLANGADGLGAIKAETANILTDTAEIGTAGVGLTNINLPNQTMDIVGDITGNLSGSVGSVTGGATSAAQTTAQNDLDILTGTDGVTLASSQPNYAPNIVVPDAAGVAPTAAEIRQEIDTNSVDLNQIQTDIAALNDISVADILTTQMTESYATDGSAPTLAQALMLIQQMLGEFSISGTTLTVKKVDGTTTVGTFTLNDGTNPTSLTRAT